MNPKVIEPNSDNSRRNFKWSLFRDFLFLLTAIIESTLLFVFFWRKRSHGKDFLIGESDDEVYSDGEEESFFSNEDEILSDKTLEYSNDKDIDDEIESNNDEKIKSNIIEDGDNENDELLKIDDKEKINDDLDIKKDIIESDNDDNNEFDLPSLKDIDFDKLDSFLNEQKQEEDDDENDDDDDDDNRSDTSIEDERSKLLAALGDFTFGNDSSSSSSRSRSSSSSSVNSSASQSSSSSSSSSSSGKSDKSEDDDIPLLKEYSVSEATNKTGLRRAKKKVISGSKKGHYQMEDVHFCAYPWDNNENLSLFCIFDGHSGRECADAAKEIVPRLLKEKLDKIELNDETDLEEILKDVFKEADEEMINFEYEGSTATVLPIWKYGKNRYFQVANIGDSSAVLVTKDGVAEQLTIDHRPSVQSERERLALMGIILNEGQNRLNGLAVSRAFGDHFPKSVECGLIVDPDVTKVIKITDEHKMIILASDGLWDVVSPQIAYNIVKDMESSKEMAETLLKTATKSKKCTDNVTVIIILL